MCGPDLLRGAANGHRVGDAALAPSACAVSASSSWTSVAKGRGRHGSERQSSVAARRRYSSASARVRCSGCADGLSGRAQGPERGSGGAIVSRVRLARRQESRCLPLERRQLRRAHEGESTGRERERAEDVGGREGSRPRAGREASRDFKRGETQETGTERGKEWRRRGGRELLLATLARSS